MEFLEESTISPPQNSVKTTKIPLTFFDMPWLFNRLVERVLLYEFPNPSIHFTQAILPQLKHSLSLVLEHYFPLAGSLVCPPLPMAPYILYENGDSIPLTIAQSNSDFHHLVQHHPKNAADFSPLVARLSNETSFLVSDDAKYQEPVKVLHPLVALQMTIFPNSGIAISFTYRHVVGDGRAMNNFIKSWASLFKSKNNLSVIARPITERATLVKDPNRRLSTILCNQWHAFGLSWDNFAAIVSNTTSAAVKQEKLHATFVLSKDEITMLRNWITSQLDGHDEPSPLPYVSTFVVTCAFMWVCFMTAQNIVGASKSDQIVPSGNDDSLFHFGILADCTEKSELNIPKTYLGNCLTFLAASVLKSELLSETGLLVAAIAIMTSIKDLENGFLRNVESWLPANKKLKSSGDIMTVAGSPKLHDYETDFGWGKPKKSEMVHIDNGVGAIAVAECRDGKGGVEVGVSLNKLEMEAFSSTFALGLKKMCAP